MRIVLLLALLVAVPAAWCAGGGEAAGQSAGPLPSARRAVHDDFVEGAGGSVLHTRDSNRFRSTRLFMGAVVDYRSGYDFTALGAGAARYDQDSWSIDRYSLQGAIRKVERATGAGVVAIAGVSATGNHRKLIGEGVWNVRTSSTAGFEFVGQREFVETRAGLESGTMSNFFAASGDFAVTDRLTLVGLAGGQWFSDDNHRMHLRGNVIYALLPEQGLSAMVRARAYDSSRPGGATYFNPENYQRADLGLRLRRSVGHWRVYAAGGGGRERIEHDLENPTYYAELRAERSFENDVTFAMIFSLSHASDSHSATGSNYTWRYFRAVVVLPF